MRVPHSGETTRWMPHSGENASVRMRLGSDGSRIIGNIQLAHKCAMTRRRLTCIAAVTANAFRYGRKRDNDASAGILTRGEGTREIATGLGLVVGAFAGMFYDAAPRFSHAFIARMTIHYYYETIFPSTPNNKDAGIRAGASSSYGSGRGEHSLPASCSVSGSVPYPSQQALRRIVVKSWTTSTVRRRLILTGQAMADRLAAFT